MNVDDLKKFKQVPFISVYKILILVAKMTFISKYFFMIYKLNIMGSYFL